ncbi:MAG: selenium-dependent xanthine dehydrogenase [Oscillospiraceae bacterium]|nr:selenium-dependent xanthine dehydrogenase [Oscillospiraceae bacterium]MCL2277869.1 selenium-dependent xanthine dehydrogenase [Oscillospiraceae bacterium]
MTELNINNQTVSCHDGGKNLITFLRDDLRLTSVKDGCSEGACGSCMVLVDGKVTKACLPLVSSLADKKVLTVEGLSEREREVFSYAFTASGAVQCGFCIPGMIISAKALIDTNQSPTRHEVKKAIHGNVCRCTGYVKIEDAILLAAEFFRDNKEIPQQSFTGAVGENFFRLDADEKVLGTGVYTDDMVVPDMVYAGALRTKYPRARILGIDASDALAHSQCIAVITADDVPGDIKCGHLVKDWDALIAVGEITRYIGDALAIAVVETKEALETVLSLIKVDYEKLAPLTSPDMSLKEGAPLIHECFTDNILSSQAVKRGDADKAISEAKYVVNRRYSLPFTEHAFLEPECAIAMPDGDDGLMLYTGGQSIYDEQREISGLLGLSKEKIRVRSCLVGGGFGGKEDMSVQHHAALAAWIVKRAVKIKFSRKESMMVHPKRHAMEIDFTTACDENGFITAVKAKIVTDTGAYASLGGPVLQRACTHAGGPYNYQNIDIEGKAVITNNPPAGAFRGFGVPQSTFAMESNLNLLAEMAGISPWEIRYRNAISPGQVLPNGQIADESSALSECLLAVKSAFDRSEYTGIAVGFKNSGLGVGVPDVGRCIISVEEGKVHVRSSAACIGQGMATILLQMVCQTLEISPNLVVIEPPDTARTPNSGTTTASRQTLFSGEAAVIAAKQLKAERDALIDGETGNSSESEILRDAQDDTVFLVLPEQLNGKEYYGEYKPHTDPMGSDKKNPVSHVAYGYAAQVAELDDVGKLKKVTAAYDMGNVVNPKSAEGQIEGGIVMGLGYALSEDFPLDNGVPTAKFGTLGLFRATAAPEIETIIVKQDRGTAPAPSPAYGAKGVGELATIPTAPAVAGAYYRLDKIFRPKLPMEDTYYDK